MLNIPFDVIECEPVPVLSVVATKRPVVEVSLLESVVTLGPVSGKDVAKLEDAVLKVLEYNFVVAETVATGVVVTEAVLEVILTGVVTITVLEVLGTDVGTLVVGLVVVVEVVVVVGVVVVIIVVAVVIVVICKPKKHHG